MRLRVLLVACLLLAAPPVAGTSPPGTPATNAPPLADAGLDRTVRVGETVLLDAGGSLDPDGRVARHEWRVETPDGDTLAPADPTAGTTRFRPGAVGRYAVTLTVTDDHGAARTDRLFVDVRARSSTATGDDGANRPPVGRIDGPLSVQRGGTATLRANVTDPDGRVVDYRWSTGATGRTTAETFDRPVGTAVPLSVTATDDDGATTRLNLTVRVRENATAGAVRSAFPPDAVVDGPTRVAVGEAATYALRASDPDGDVERYEWDRPARVAGRTLTQTFTEPGTYTVRGTVYDDTGVPDEAATTVEVYGEGEPAASLSGPERAPAGSVRTYRLEAFDPDGGRVDVSWSPARDGVNGSRFENRVRMPDAPGSTVTVSATVTDDEGESVTVERSVRVREAVTTDGTTVDVEHAALAVSDPTLWRVSDASHQTSASDVIEVGEYAAEACVESDVDAPLTATWEFGDGAVKTQSLGRVDGEACTAVRHVVGSENGSRVRLPVRVTVADGAGHAATARVVDSVRTVAVHDRVNVSASTGTWSATDGRLTVPAGTRVTFTVETLQSFRVEYGDGTVGEFARGPADTRLSYVYDAPGTYTVQLTSSQGPNGYGMKRVTVRVVRSTAGAATVSPDA